jgi:rhodanese-related sulfurtransferase
VTHPRLSARDAHALLRDQGYAYLDVRTEQEFALGHPAGAYNVPLLRRGGPGPGLQENGEFLATVAAAFGIECRLVVGCESGHRSRTAAQRLLGAGFGAVVEQRAGYEGTRDAFGRLSEKGWRAEGLPCADEAMEGRDYAALRTRRGKS